jgi:hypothetical protein
MLQVVRVHPEPVEGLAEVKALITSSMAYPKSWFDRLTMSGRGGHFEHGGRSGFRPPPE